MKRSNSNDSTVRVAEFSVDPGPRFTREGKWSGEEFRNVVIEAAFDLAVRTGATLRIDLDGTYGIPVSFLEEAFGGLVRLHRRQNRIYDYRHFLEFTSRNPRLIERVWKLIDDASRR